MLQEARNDPAIWHAHILPLHQRLRQQMGLKAAPPPPKAQSSRILYYHSDHLGTPRELTNRHGNIVWAATYKAWGATQSIDYPPILQTVQSGNTVQEQWVEQSRYDRPIQNLRFQGQYFDQETGLHYNRFRYYDPDIGRFISQDPIGLYGGDNLYQYAPNPTGWIDPSGLAGLKYIVLGEGQSSVDRYAGMLRKKHQSNDYETISDQWNTITQDKSLEGLKGKDWTCQAAKLNADWVKSKIREGYRFIIIGKDSQLHRSPFYKAELEALRQEGIKPVDHTLTPQHKANIEKARCCAAASSIKPKPRPNHQC